MTTAFEATTLGRGSIGGFAPMLGGARGEPGGHCTCGRGTQQADADAGWPFAGLRVGYPARQLSSALCGSVVSNAPLVEIEFGPAEEGYLRLHERRPVDFSAGKRVLIFGVGGAFADRPTAKIRHYAQLAAQLGGAAIDEVWCVAIHDPYIVGLWGVDLLPQPYFRLLCDATGDWTAASGLADPESIGGDRPAAVEYSLLMLSGAVERIACRDLT
jgi:peroxiredoxin